MYYSRKAVQRNPLQSWKHSSENVTKESSASRSPSSNTMDSGKEFFILLFHFLTAKGCDIIAIDNLILQHHEVHSKELLTLQALRWPMHPT